MSLKVGSASLLDTEASCTTSIGECSARKHPADKGISPRKQRLAKKKGNWSAEEDALLLSWVHERGPCKWTQCSKGIKGRCGKQCRERWVNILNPSVKKGKWSQQEQTQIFTNLCTHLTAWSAIAKILPGRTENSIKNYFYSSLRRIQGNAVIELVRQCITAPASSSSDDRKAQLEKHMDDLNVLGQLICRFVVDSGSSGEFYDLLRSQLMLDEGRETVMSLDFEDSLLSYPVVEMPSLSASSVCSQLREGIRSGVSSRPRCWNCLGSGTCRHELVLASI